MYYSDIIKDLGCASLCINEETEASGGQTRCSRSHRETATGSRPTRVVFLELTPRKSMKTGASGDWKHSARVGDGSGR